MTTPGNIQPGWFALIIGGTMTEAVSVSTSDSATSLPIQWLESHGDALYAYALGRVRHREVAEDLVQETLLAAMQGLEKFAMRANVRTWLTGILRHKISDHLRARYRHDTINSGSSAGPDEELFDRRGKWKSAVPKWQGDPHTLAVQAEFRGVMDSCMSKLPARMAHLFLSRVSDGTDTEELCREFQITPENAWMLLHRARSKLRQCLTVNWFDVPKKTLSSSRRTKR